MDVWTLQKTPRKECMVLRPMWFCLGRLHSVPQIEEAAIEIGIKKDVLDSTGSPALGRSLWRRSEPTATTKEESWQRQRETQGSQWTSTTDPCAPAATANWPPRPTATLDEHAPSTRCSNVIGINNSVTGGTEAEGGLHTVEEGQPGNSDAGAPAVRCGRDEGRIKEGCQDAVYCGGYLDKGTRRAGHCASCRSNLMTQWRSFLTMSLERFQTVHRPLSESGAGASGEHQEVPRKSFTKQKRTSARRRRLPQ